GVGLRRLDLLEERMMPALTRREWFGLVLAVVPARLAAVWRCKVCGAKNTDASDKAWCRVCGQYRHPIVAAACWRCRLCFRENGDCAALACRYCGADRYNQRATG